MLFALLWVMQLRFELSAVEGLATQYSLLLSPEELELMRWDKQRLREEGMTLTQLARLARWKSPRSAPLIQRNDDAYVREITRFALTTTHERARIEALTLLSGVAWPTASVILHLYHPDRYPILDFRALWSVQAGPNPIYDFGFWTTYVKFCREQAAQANVDMRTLDRALWQYSKNLDSLPPSVTD